MINDKGLEILKRYEGCSLDVYRDPIGIWTIGHGSCFSFDGDRVGMGHRKITASEATVLLLRSCRQAENGIARLVRVPLTDNQRSALISFVYNVGVGNFQRSTMRMKLNRASYEGAANEFWKWRRAGGRILRGLVARRKSEARLFRTISQKDSSPLGHPLVEVL
jgi:GH24 family phage-related lysozyme (muramidase)|tara:strand:+ start:1478 stop:1969 length:492 start_codon:yes stop_codon:yes gene_type:complete